MPAKTAPVVCETCGKTFEKQVSRVKRTKYHFCSVDCFTGAKYRDKSGQYVPCETCGIMVYKYLSQLKVSNHYYCSRTCRQAAGRVATTCASCGKDLSIYTHDYAPTTPRYCSRECYFAAGRETLICANCQKSFLRTHSDVVYQRLQGVKHFFCSNPCRKTFDYQLPAPVWNPSEGISAYFAGIIDGEGTIRCSYNTKQPTQPVEARVAISSTTHALMIYLQENFPFRSHILKPAPRKNPRHKPAWAFYTSGRFAITLLTPLVPWLVIKKEQATLVIAFQQLSLAERHWEGQGQWYFERLKELNKRGVDIPT